MFRIFALLESVRNLLQRPYNIIHLTLGMLLHYLGKLKILIFLCRCGRKRNQIAFLITSSFVIHPQILLFPIGLLIANKITFAINLWHRKFVASLRRHCSACQQSTWYTFSDEDRILIKKSLHLKGYAAKRFAEKLAAIRYGGSRPPPNP